jgi:amidase
VKDLAETAGIRTTFGSPLFASFVPDFDAPHVAPLKHAGAVVIGKTNTPEFGRVHRAAGVAARRGAARMARLAPLLRDHRDQVKATLAWNIEKGLALGGEQIAAARAGHAEIFQRFSSFLADGGYEVLALPTVQVVPFPVEQEWVTEINGEPMTTYIDWMRSCSRITVTVHPAVSVPAGLTAAGLPVGLQLVGRYGADRQLLEIAAAIMELATGALS